MTKEIHKMNSKATDFVAELIGYIFAYPDDDYMTMEVLCRKLHKHGLIERKDGEWTCNFIYTADTPQAEHINTCPICGDVPSIRFEIGCGWEVLCKGHNETSWCPTRDWAIQSWNELVEAQTERSE